MAATDDQSSHLYFNGVNGATGDYGVPPMTSAELADVLQGESDEALLQELKWRHSQKGRRHFGVKEGVDPRNLEETGWGVIFAHDADPAVREALAPLLKLRLQQAGERYRLFERGAGFRVGKDSKTQFLQRQGVGPGPVDPDKIPYYLLIVGNPETIPYRFQTQIGVQFATGRIDFGADLDAYANYADSVVAAEAKRFELPRRINFFGVANEDDPATGLSTEHLISPLLQHLGDRQPGWQTQAFLKDRARKADLANLLGGPETPALLFTASHGMEFPNGDPRQIPHQGALLCQDWPGPKAWRGRGPIPQDCYFAGDDLSSNANLLGLIGFFFACFGCGTPRLDEFSKQAFQDRRATIAPHAFLSGLPTRMLSNPGGGALAVIGHVERAWGCSFVWQGAGAQTTVFESTLDRLLTGHPVGSALEYFNERYAELSTVLADELEEIEYGKQVDPYDLAGMWTANNDARGYMILGDPAVRLPVVEPGGQATARPSLDLRSLSPSALGARPPSPVAEAAPPARAASPAAAPSPAASPSPAGAGASASTSAGPPAAQSPAAQSPAAQSPAVTPSPTLPPAPATPPTPATPSPATPPARPEPTPVATTPAADTSEVAEDTLSGQQADPNLFFGVPGDGAAATDHPSEIESLRELVGQLGRLAKSLLAADSPLVVETWVSDSTEPIRYHDQAYAGAKLSASTRIEPDGGTRSCVARNPDGSVPSDLWAIHSESVQQAMKARVEWVDRIEKLSRTGVRLLQRLEADSDRDPVD